VVRVTAAVLLYRAVTYLPTIPLGALACLAWRHAPALMGTGSLTRADVPAHPPTLPPITAADSPAK
jgi:hypothetical protein